MRYMFGDYSLDTERHELLHADTLIKLRPKVFHVLAYLVSHRDRMVPKDELLETIWPRVVGEAVLSSCVMAARRAVGDDGHAQRVIKTMHGLGYRFVAPVREAEHNPAEALPSELPESTDGAELAGPEASSSGVTPLDTSVAPSVSHSLTKEHKTVTVLACSIAQAKDLAERLGPEAMHELMQGFFVRARAVMDRYEGSIVQWWGDGFLALFGAPVAHEDDARRAVLASLELKEVFVSHGSSIAGSSFHSGYTASMGLHTGSVVVGTQEETPFLRPYTARGETTDVAARLRKGASPGTILLSENTYRMVETEVDAEPSTQGSGESPTYQLLGVTRQRAGVPKRFDSYASRFVGRNEELAILHERLNRLEKGAGQVIGVAGVPGIGKSRLLDEFRTELPAGKVTYLEGHCLPYSRTTPYLPLIELIRELCAIRDTDDATNITAKIRAYLECMETTEETEPLLLELLGVPVDRELLMRLSPQARRGRTFALLRELVFNAAAVRPILVVVEDLHWIDATSEEWLSGFVGRLGDAAILLLVTYRTPYSPAWLGLSSATQLALSPLTPTDSAILVQSISHQGRVSQEVTEDIVAKADGNPFFLEELTHAFKVGADRPRPTSIPNTIQAVLTARIDGLDAMRKELLQTCSVIGTRVPHVLLRHVTELDADELDTSLGHLEETGFLFETRAMPERTYRFKHALTQEVTYQGILRGIREDRHSRIAEVLEHHFNNIVANQPEVLARHHTEAGNNKVAVDYWQRAGRKAYERSAHLEAISYSTRGLEVLANASIEECHSEKELSLQLTLAPALMAAKGYGAPEVERACSRARTLCEHIGDEQQMFRALVGLWNFYWVRGELGTARNVASQLLGLAERAKDPARQLRAHAAMGEVLFHTGEIEASYQHLQKGVALYQATPRRSFATQTPQVACLCYAAWALWHLGFSDQSLVRAREAIALAEELSHPLSLTLSLTFKSELHQFRLEVTECRELAERAVAVCREQGLPFWEGSALILLGWAQAMGGHFNQGHQTMEQGLKVFAETGARVQHTPWLGMFAEIHSHNGHLHEGLSAVEEAFVWVGQTGELYYHSELYRLRGDLLLKRDEEGDPQAAEDAFTSALDVAHLQGAKMRQLRAAVSLAHLWRDQGRTEEAVALIESVLLLFNDDSDSVDVKNARALLKSLS